MLTKCASCKCERAFTAIYHKESHRLLWRTQSARRVATSALGKEKVNVELLTVEAVARIADARGLHLSVKEFGPAYTIECRSGSKNGPILGTTSGFTVPFTKLMHCDSMQVFTRGRGSDETVQKGFLHGIGYLLATAVFAFGYWKGFRKAEILAINDSDYAHERLKKYYTRLFGFKTVREVTGKVSDLPHLLVWGGLGTRMDGNLEDLLRRCSRAFRDSSQE